MAVRQDTTRAASEDAEADRRYVTALARGLQVLQTFRAEDNGLSNAELANRTGFPKPTVSRLTFTLLSLGYLDIDRDTGRYSIHPHILTLGYPVLQRLSIREIARPYMRELADSCRSAVAMAMRDGLDMIVIERSRHETMMTIPVDIGVGRQLATSALGRAYLAAIQPAEREDLLWQIKSTDEKNWPRIRAGIEENLSRFMERGFTLSDGEWRNDYTSVAVPLVLSDRTIVSFSNGGTRGRFSAAEIEEMGRKLVDMVGQVGRIGGQGSIFAR